MNKEIYAVILHKHEDLDDFYNDMETEGGNLYIPDRQVQVRDRKPISRSTFYILTPKEANQVRQDPRVEDVSIIFEDDYPVLFNKSRSSGQDADHVNWGLDTHVDPAITNFPFTGKHVDIVIADDDGWQPDHPEFLDDNGNSRVVQYNWYQHADEVGDILNRGRTWDYTQDTNNGYHNIHVAGTAAGRTNGWAKDANIYFIGIAFSGNSEQYNVSASRVFDYIRAFHKNKPINPVTGRKNPTIVNNSWGASSSFGLFGLSLTSIDTITYKGEIRTPESELSFNFEGNYLLCSKDQVVLEWPKDTVIPRENTVKFTTSATGTSTATVDRMALWPDEWDKIPNQVSSFIQNSPTNNNNEIYVHYPCDVKSNATIGATCESSESFIRIRRIINNSPLPPIDFYGPDIQIDMRGLTRFGLMGVPGGATPIRYIVEEYPTAGDEITWEVDWNFSTHEYNTQTLAQDNIDELGDTYVEYKYEEIVPQEQTYSGTVEQITYDGFPSDPEADGFTHHPWYDYDLNDHIIDWNLMTLPWNIEYLGSTYNQLRFSQNSYITFGSEQLVGSNGSTPDNPLLPKLLLDTDADVTIYGSFYRRYINNFWSKLEGEAGSRTFTIVATGYFTYLAYRIFGSSPDSHSVEWKVKFYENEPDRIDITFGRNNHQKAVNGWTEEQVEQYGCNRRQFGASSPTVVADAMDAINDGIILVAAAGNSNAAMYDDTHIMYNNSINFRDGSVAYYNRPSSPGGAGMIADNAMITVGALSNFKFNNKETRTSFSNYGNIVDIFAAGHYIQSAWPASGKTGSSYPVTKNGFLYAKISGTSMASPQVCGLLACMLEKYPDMNQKQARELLRTFSIHNEMYDLPLETWDHVRSLEEAANQYILFKKIRKENIPVWPPVFKGRPKSGVVYPRNQIKRRKKV